MRKPLMLTALLLAGACATSQSSDTGAEAAAEPPMPEAGASKTNEGGAAAPAGGSQGGDSGDPEVVAVIKVNADKAVLTLDGLRIEVLVSTEGQAQLIEMLGEAAATMEQDSSSSGGAAGAPRQLENRQSRGFTPPQN